MATEKQIASNRANAQFSTGPRTEAGKAASSRNHLSHGLAARGFLVLPSMTEAFTQLEAGLRQDLLPSGTLQEVLFKLILECGWNLERCRQATLDLHTSNGSSDRDSLLDADPRYASIQRYAKQAHNGLSKALRELAKLQTEAHNRRPAEPVSVTVITKLRIEPKSTATTRPIPPNTDLNPGAATYNAQSHPAQSSDPSDWSSNINM